MDSEHDHLQRRDADSSPAVRLTGLSAQQLAVQLIGGLILAAVVGLMSSWATQRVMAEQLQTLSRQLDELRSDMRQMRQDIYAPRFKQGALERQTAMRARP